MHGLLESAQPLVPNGLRSRVRKHYLNYFYYPLFPEKNPATVVAVSSYQPFVDFKSRLYRNFPLDFSGVSCCCKPGLVSVVLPVFNQAQWLPVAVESVLSQTYPAIQLIIVDDGSTDETPRVLEGYAGQRGIKMVRQSNQKLPGALNEGFRHAQGEYYTWISADNQMLPEQIGEQVSFLRSHPEVEFVYADEEIMDASGAAFRESGWCSEFQDPSDSAIVHWPRDPGRLNFTPSNYIGACVLYRAWVGRIIGPYIPELCMVEDYDYWMRINALFRIAFIGKDAPLYRYRLHASSLTARHDELGIFKKAQALVAQDQRRRDLYLEDAEVQLIGEHPWFEYLAKLYAQSGYRVRRLAGEDTDPTASCVKRLSIIPAAARAKEGTAARRRPDTGKLEVVLLDRRTRDLEARAAVGEQDWALITDPRGLERFGPNYADRLLFARTPEAAAYPLMALLNSRVATAKFSQRDS